MAEPIDVLQRLLQWDHLATAADGAYWKAEIESALRSSAIPQQQMQLRMELAERQVERFALCPDHRDKATGRCIVCVAEERTRQDVRSSAIPTAEWQPIETAPKDGSFIVLHTPEFGNVPDVGQWFDGGDRGWWVSHALPIHPTHWMPLPQPPSALRGSAEPRPASPPEWSSMVRECYEFRRLMHAGQWTSNVCATCGKTESEHGARPASRPEQE